VSIALHGLAVLWLFSGQSAPGKLVQASDADVFIVALSTARPVESPMLFKSEPVRASKPVRTAQQGKPGPSPVAPERKAIRPAVMDQANEQALHAPPAVKATQAETLAGEAVPVFSSRSIKGGEGKTHRIRHHLEHYKFYPVSARRRGIEGAVEVGFQLDGKGYAQGLIVLAGSGYSMLDRAAKETVKRAEPFPATGGDFHFTLQFHKL
jgi:protein TonB